MINNPALYALVPKTTRRRAGPAAVTVLPKPKRHTPPGEQARHAERRGKQAIDLADALLTRLENRAAAYSQEIARLQKRKAAANARIERLTDEILQRMENAALRKADGWKIVFEARPCPASVAIFDEDLVPAIYLRTKEVTAPNKTAIKEALEQQLPVPGAKLVQRLTLLRK